MALHAQVQLPLTAQPRRINDGSLWSFPCPHCLDMGAPRAMAALAVDATGKRPAKYRSGSGSVSACFNLRITVVAEHALVGNLPAEVFLVGPVVTRIHCPIAVIRGV